MKNSALVIAYARNRALWHLAAINSTHRSATWTSARVNYTCSTESCCNQPQLIVPEVYSHAAISPNKGHCTGLQTLVGAQEPSNSVNTEVELGFHSELDTQSFAAGLTKSFRDTV